MSLTVGCYTPPSSKEISSQDLEQGVTEEGIHASLWREKLYILGTEEILSL
jgi:hypothetical protein